MLPKQTWLRHGAFKIHATDVYLFVDYTIPVCHSVCLTGYEHGGLFPMTHVLDSWHISTLANISSCDVHVRSLGNM